MPAAFPTSPFRDDLFAGKKVLITGGGTGMGRAMTRAFAAHGADVFITSRKEENLKPTADEVSQATGREVRWKTCDVREMDQVESMMDAASDWFGGHVDVLVNNAAGNFLTSFDGMSKNAWNAVINIVLNGTFNVTKAAFPKMQDKGGSIVNMVATYAWGAAPLVSHSGAAKAGVLNLTRSLAVEWASYGIRMNAMAPGVVVTKDASQNLGFADEDSQKRVLESIPARRFGTPEEMALGVLWLSSPSSSYVTGECLVVDGGQWLMHGMFG